jgi:kumamolisin
MTSTRSGLLVLLAVGAAAGSSLAGPAKDLGRLSAVSSEQVTATVALKLQNADQLEGLVAALYNRGAPSYHQFLTPEAFQARFAPSAATVAKVTAAMQKQGLTVELINGNLLSVTGTSSAVERTFGVQLHQFQSGQNTFHAPTGPVQLSADVAAEVDGVAGLNTEPRLHPHHRASTLHGNRTHTLAKAPTPPADLGDLTVLDFAQYYNVNPLYKAGITGKGTTIGIVTLAAFTPSDAFTYWNALGLKTNANRLSIVTVGKGPGPASDASGSDETTLDVEQSGGLAPGAKIIVYQAANGGDGFLKAFARAIGDNKADAISTSWGEWEEFLAPGNAVTDTTAAGQLNAFHNLFIQAAIQGQSLTAASGDAGSFDTSGELPDGFNDVLSVDHPAADPFMCAAGGTTLPGLQPPFFLPDGTPFLVNLPKERAWSWDYLDPFCALLGLDPVSCGIFPVGDGGGVSVVFPVPFFQDGLPGIAVSEPKQTLIDSSQTPPQKVLTLPARFHGRNVPDISMNADPDTGYLLFYTSDVSGFAIDEFGGGTSFVAPQLAGVTALINQDAGGRIGLLSFALYDLAFSGLAYSGRNPPLRDITDGNNEFYNAHAGYDQASGLGVLNVANLAAFFR